ncbi:hypothetical protein LJB42_002567 [Komagataella kurtzmanii]|nr:hypothetical protein LJB42_002567 [Komagataella kurtzmanii]
MHLILLRHCTRIDKTESALKIPSEKIDTSEWISSFDAPVCLDMATEEVSIASKSINEYVHSPNLIIHSSPYNRCIQTAELLMDKLEGAKCKLRVDHGLSEWLNVNFKLNYLPPNDNGISLISNLNNYIYGNPLKGTLLRDTEDPSWLHNKLGTCGEYGESLKEFKTRCFHYLRNLNKHYTQHEVPENTTIVVISHGAVIFTLLQTLIDRPIFNEIPLCVPIFFKKLDLYNYMLKDYDETLASILSIAHPNDLNILLDTEIDTRRLKLDYNEYVQSNFTSPQLESRTSRETNNRRRGGSLDIDKLKSFLGDDDDSSESEESESENSDDSSCVSYFVASKESSKPVAFSENSPEPSSHDPIPPTAPKVKLESRLFSPLVEIERRQNNTGDLDHTHNHRDRSRTVTLPITSSITNLYSSKLPKEDISSLGNTDESQASNYESDGDDDDLVLHFGNPLSDSQDEFVDEFHEKERGYGKGVFTILSNSHLNALPGSSSRTANDSQVKPPMPSLSDYLNATIASSNSSFYKSDDDVNWFGSNTLQEV